MLFGYDWQKRPVPITLSRKHILDDISFINVIVVSGDEILDIYYDDFTHQKVDCGPTRIRDFYDGSYIVWPADITRWLERKSSYDFKFWN